MIAAHRVTLAVEGWNASDLESREIFERSLQSLAEQTYPLRDCQVQILLDSQVREAEMAWTRKYLPSAQIVPVEAATYYRSKNRAFHQAEGDYLIFADSDVVYSRTWLAEMLACLEAGNELVVGNTQFESGPLSLTLTLCDWSALRLSSGPTDWFYGNNLGLARRARELIRFREDLGTSGGGAVNILRGQLKSMGLQAWFCAEATARHHLAPFWEKRLRSGAFQIRYRQLAPETRWSWLARIPMVAPVLVTAGTLLKTYRRAWRLRSLLPLRGWSLPFYLFSIAAVKAVELVGATLLAWFPNWVSRRYGWFDVPSSATATTEFA